MEKEIGPKELVQRLQSGDRLAVVDIREEAEFDGWHIHGSRNVPVYEALRANRPDALVEAAGTLPDDRPLITVCRGGIVSVRAAEVLRGLGREALSLRGGIRGWGGVWTEAPIDLEGRDGAVLIQVRRNGKGCLSYVVGHGGEAVVVDPSVDIEAYLEIARRLGLTIGKVLETHVHADHLSRARELSARTGATLILPENGRVEFDYSAIRDGETVVAGELQIRAIATPGHTGESTCYLVDGQVLLTGDTLFAEAVGRPDLEKGDAGADAGARALYRSLNRLLDKQPDVRFYPAHCGRAIGFDGVAIGSTTAAAKRQLELLRLDEQGFVSRVVGSLTAKPPNYESVIAVNEGRVSLGGTDPLELEAGPNRCAAG